MTIDASEISAILKSEIKNLDNDPTISEVGTVLTVGDKAHPAVSGNGQPVVITETRHLDTGFLTGMQDGGPVFYLYLDAVHCQLWHGFLAPYSAASTALAERCATIRRSISGRKFLIRPWMGHAAASPSAQMVWPSTWRVTCSSVSIS